MEDRKDFDNYISNYINKIKNGYASKQTSQLNLPNQSSSKQVNIQSHSIISIPPEASQDSYKTIPNGKFIQIIYNEKLCSIPLDFDILRCIEQQDDVEITFENNYVVRDDVNNGRTFKINNALRRAYLIRLFRLDISEELKEYLKRYDVYTEYRDITSITSVKTMVNELAYIYYLETKSKNNNNLAEEQLNNIRLDKGFDIKTLKKIRRIYE